MTFEKEGKKDQFHLKIKKNILQLEGEIEEEAFLFKPIFIKGNSHAIPLEADSKEADIFEAISEDDQPLLRQLENLNLFFTHRRVDVVMLDPFFIAHPEIHTLSFKPRKTMNKYAAYLQLNKKIMLLMEEKNTHHYSEEKVKNLFLQECQKLNCLSAEEKQRLKRLKGLMKRIGKSK